MAYVRRFGLGASRSSGSRAAQPIASCSVEASDPVTTRATGRPRVAAKAGISAAAQRPGHRRRGRWHGCPPLRDSPTSRSRDAPMIRSGRQVSPPTRNGLRRRRVRREAFSGSPCRSPWVRSGREARADHRSCDGGSWSREASTGAHASEARDLVRVRRRRRSLRPTAKATMASRRIVRIRSPIDARASVCEERRVGLAVVADCCTTAPVTAGELPELRAMAISPVQELDLCAAAVATVRVMVSKPSDHSWLRQSLGSEVRVRSAAKGPLRLFAIF